MALLILVLSVQVIAPGEDSMVAGFQKKCTIGKCGQDGVTLRCYKWDWSWGKWSSRLFCYGEEMPQGGSQNEGSLFLGNAPGAVVADVANANCDYYYAGDGATVKASDGSHEGGRWADVPEVKGKYDEDELFTGWVAVPDKFMTVPMNGCSLMVRNEGNNWHVGHTSSGFHVYKEITEGAAHHTQILFPCNGGTKTFFLWGQVNADNHKLVVYVGSYPAVTSAEHEFNNHPTAAKWGTVFPGWSTCQSVTFTPDAHTHAHAHTEQRRQHKKRTHLQRKTKAA